MKYSMVILKVRDIKAWKENYHSEESEASRKRAGEIDWRIYQTGPDKNVIVLINEWEDETKALAFFDSEELRNYQKESGVMDPPQFFLFEELDTGSL